MLFSYVNLRDRNVTLEERNSFLPIFVERYLLIDYQLVAIKRILWQK